MATFGRLDQGASSYHEGDYIDCSLYTLGEDGNISKITVYLKNETGQAVNSKALIYDSSRNLVVESDEVSVPDANDGWVDFPCNNELLSAGNYWMGRFSDEVGSTVMRSYYDNDGTGAYEAMAYPNPEDPIVAFDGTGSERFSVYATYTPVAGGVSIPIVMHHRKMLGVS